MRWMGTGLGHAGPARCVSGVGDIPRWGMEPGEIPRATSVPVAGLDFLACEIRVLGSTPGWHNGCWTLGLPLAESDAMKAPHRILIPLATLAMMQTGAARAAETALDGLDWLATGAAGLIGGTATMPLSPLDNPYFGFVTTTGGAGHFGSGDNVSPLELKSDGKGNEGNNNGTKIVSSAFTGLAGDTLSLQFNYISTDGRGYEDYAWARLVDADTDETAAWLFTTRSTNSARGNVVPGDVLNRQVDSGAPDELDAVLNDGDRIGFDVASTVWQPLGTWSGYCWDNANTCGPSGWIQSEYTFASDGNYYLEFGVVNWGDEAFDSALAFDFSGLNALNFPNAPLITAVPEPETYAMMLAGLALVAGRAIRRRRGA